jgi:NAD(P)-dependent dehydrogenase (short-subunit alcohol dehydrogenase family)
MRLKDKVIIVTGSTTGIGKAIALRCAAEGAFIVLSGLEAELGVDVLTELGSDRAVLHIEDISEKGAPARLVKLAMDKFGRLDAIVNNAAIVASSDISTTDQAFMEKLFAVNTIAPLLLIQAAVPFLSVQHGSVLNIGSVNAYCGEPNLLAYSITKGALMTMSRNLGDSLQRDHGIRVNQLNPGWVLTEKEIQRKLDQGLEADWYKQIPPLYAPAERLLHPSEIAAAAIYWLSDESAPISGQVVEIEQYPIIGRNPPKLPQPAPSKK